MKTWVAMLSALAAASGAVLSAGLWLYGNLEHRIEKQADSTREDIKELQASIAEVKIQVATIAAKEEASAPKKP